MKKQIALFLICCLASFSALATDIVLTNHSNEVMHVDVNLALSNAPLRQGLGWTGQHVELAPYSTRKVLSFNRNDYLVAGGMYQYLISMTTAQHPLPLEIALTVKADEFYGSDLTARLINVGDGQKQQLNLGKDIDKFNVQWDGQAYHFYHYAWLPFSELFDNYDFVIKAPDHPIPNTLNEDNQLSVLSYNTQLMPFYTSIVNDLNQPHLRVKKIPQHVQQYDVVVLQELLDRNLRNTMINEMRKTYPYYTNVVGADTLKPLTGGVMIFSKWPIVHEAQTVFRFGAGMDIQAAKGVAYAEIEKMGKRYHIFGTHLQAGNSTLETSARHQQLTEFANFIQQQHIRADEPVLLAGDFNTDANHDSEYQYLLTTLHVAPAYNSGYPFSSDSVINTMNVGDERARLDYVFYHLDYLTPYHADNHVFVLRDYTDVNMWPQNDLSDHFPVLGTFHW